MLEEELSRGKIIVDTYGGMGRIGGGCLSSKDPTKVDRSGAYKAREIAKQVLRDNPKYYWCSVQLSYAIGIDKPLAIYITTDLGDIKVPESLYEECTPKRIIEDLNLKKECFFKRARYGHFVD